MPIYRGDNRKLRQDGVDNNDENILNEVEFDQKQGQSIDKLLISLVYFAVII